uniref:Reverse transcriptase zinc-binding domain-containing protein n=1 Tax=Fagus sylvatica TaxID=28930 RepID=A0A2N9F0V6_FAGSY
MLRASSSDPTPQNRFWKQIWTLKVPPKLKHFAWHVAHDLDLPTKENLVKRKVLQDPTCDRCKGICEWVGHALFTCPCVQDAWCAANVDRAIFKSEGKMGVRVIVRDGEGKVMGALSEKMPGRLAVEEVEALAM